MFGGNNIYNYPSSSMPAMPTIYANGFAAYKVNPNARLGSPLESNSWYITSKYGNRIHPVTEKYSLHTGIDISADVGTPVVSVHKGIVVFAGWKGAFGNLIIIKGDDGLETWYAHLSTILVSQGQAVERGQRIGLSGNTGTSTGPHLHFEVRINNESVDPSEYLGLTADIPNVLPEELKYIEVNQDKLRAWLNSRNSILADEPYFSAIVSTAKDHDINPILMFAIPGQEQSLVPRTNKNAYRIANNPYNVHHSWYEYNTDIYDSADIACHTILRLSKDRPSTVNPLAWINRVGQGGGYAEDPGWWLGVSKIFATIKKAVS